MRNTEYVGRSGAGGAGGLVDNTDARGAAPTRDEIEEVARLGAFSWDPTTGVLAATPGLQRTMGLPRAGPWTLDQFLDRFEPDDAEVLRDRLDDVAVTGERFVGDYRVVVGGSRCRIECCAALAPPPPGGSARVVGTCRDVTDDRAFIDELVDFALRDPLTGALNRFASVDRLSHALDRLDRLEGQVAVLFVDLEGLMEINDRLGHRAGDETLRALGRHLHGCVRVGDSVGRYGGDEFVVVCEDIHVPKDAGLIAIRIASSVNTPDGGSPLLSITASVGVTAAMAREPADAVIARSDDAMYEAKRSGGGRVVFRPPPDAGTAAPVE